MYILLILFVVLLIALYLISQRRPNDYPPGPYGLPILGHLLQMERPFQTLLQLKEKYGPIVSVNFGSYPTVGISDYKILREVLNDSSFAGRPKLNVFCHRSRDVEPRGLIFTEGQQWKEQRVFTVRQLKELGYAKASLETIIQEEILEFTNHLKDECGHPISLKTRFHTSILNIIWSLIVGERNDVTASNEVATLFKAVTQSMEENNGLASLCMFVPWFAKLFPKLSGLEEMNKELGPIWNFFEKHIKFHKNTYIPGQTRDFLDMYLREIENTTNPSSSFYKDTGDKSMMTILLDLFFAGGETTANTLHWICTYLAVFPDIQKRMQKEIDEVIVNSRLSLLSDELNMPYTWAVIQESLRYSCLTPVAIFHSTTKDTVLRGFKIPKDTIVLMNVYSALMDKDYWKDPEVFRPERHLDSEGKMIKHEPMLMFGAGKRVCIGEVLARNELFLWVTTLFQKFSISVDPNNPNPTLEPIVSWIQLPPDNQFIFEQRKD